MKYPKDIFCLEGDWETSLKRKNSVQAMLTLLEDKIVHFGSCSTLLAKEETKRYFLQKTKAKAISGYTTDIAFIESTALDLLYFEVCQEYSGAKTIHNQLKKRYPDLCERLGFEMYY
jgi:hypothetical protein